MLNPHADDPQEDLYYTAMRYLLAAAWTIGIGDQVVRDVGTMVLDALDGREATGHRADPTDPETCGLTMCRHCQRPVALDDHGNWTHRAEPF